jgi:hypothetical protein
VRLHLVSAPFHAVVHDDPLGPYRALALRVISVAVRDLIAPGHSVSDRNSARAFLSGSRMLTHWCKLADIDPEAIRKQMGVAEETQRMVSERIPSGSVVD